MKKFVSALLVFLLCNSLFAKPKNENEDDNKLVKRRVLILDFVNIQNSEDYGYLEQSIPDALLDPLDQTDSFELMSRSLWSSLRKKLHYKKQDAYDQEKAIKAGQSAGADVVVIGSFIVLNDEMQINARAIELSSERVMVSRSVITPLTGNMFSAINNLANRMAKDMKEKLPPLPQQVIVKERVKYVGAGPVTTFGIIWRTLVAPGWGHLYSDRKRGWIYLPVWAGSIGFLGMVSLRKLRPKKRMRAPRSAGI